MSKNPRGYQAEGIVVRFELARCIHAAECVRGLPEVFDPQRRPWIEPDRATPEDIARVVARCPTGALTYERLDGGAAEAEPRTNRATPMPNGPLFAHGDFRLSLAEGETLAATRLALCRCGASENKPFCDNRHKAAGFTDDGTLGANRMAPRAPDPDESEAAQPVQLSAAPDGPLLFAGPLEVGPSAAEPSASQMGGKGALCRCGASRNRPYCDGSHVAAGFEAD